MLHHSSAYFIVFETRLNPNYLTGNDFGFIRPPLRPERWDAAVIGRARPVLGIPMGRIPAGGVQTTGMIATRPYTHAASRHTRAKSPCLRSSISRPWHPKKRKTVKWNAPVCAYTTDRVSIESWFCGLLQQGRSPYHGITRRPFRAPCTNLSSC